MVHQRYDDGDRSGLWRGFKTAMSLLLIAACVGVVIWFALTRLHII